MLLEWSAHHYYHRQHQEGGGVGGGSNHHNKHVLLEDDFLTTDDAEASFDYSTGYIYHHPRAAAERNAATTIAFRGNRRGGSAAATAAITSASFAPTTFSSSRLSNRNSSSSSGGGAHGGRRASAVFESMKGRGVLAQWTAAAAASAAKMRLHNVGGGGHSGGEKGGEAEDEWDSSVAAQVDGQSGDIAGRGKRTATTAGGGAGEYDADEGVNITSVGSVGIGAVSEGEMGGVGSASVAHGAGGFDLEGWLNGGGGGGDGFVGGGVGKRSASGGKGAGGSTRCCCSSSSAALTPATTATSTSLAPWCAGGSSSLTPSSSSSSLARSLSGRCREKTEEEEERARFSLNGGSRKNVVTSNGSGHEWRNIHSASDGMISRASRFKSRDSFSTRLNRDSFSHTDVACARAHETGIILHESKAGLALGPNETKQDCLVHAAVYDASHGNCGSRNARCEGRRSFLPLQQLQTKRCRQELSTDCESRSGFTSVAAQTRVSLMGHKSSKEEARRVDDFDIDCDSSTRAGDIVSASTVTSTTAAAAEGASVSDAKGRNSNDKDNIIMATSTWGAAAAAVTGIRFGAGATATAPAPVGAVAAAQGARGQQQQQEGRTIDWRQRNFQQTQTQIQPQIQPQPQPQPQQASSRRYQTLSSTRQAQQQKQQQQNQKQQQQQQKQPPSRIWKMAVDPKSGRTYYYDAVTRETQWRKPLELATDDERRAIREKEKQQREFFAAMEANILRCMQQGQVPGAKSASGDGEEREGLGEMRATTMSAKVGAAASASASASSTEKRGGAAGGGGKVKLLPKSSKPTGGTVRTISTMGDDLLAEITKVQKNQQQQQPKRQPSAKTSPTSVTALSDSLSFSISRSGSSSGSDDDDEDNKNDNALGSSNRKDRAIEEVRRAANEMMRSAPSPCAGAESSPLVGDDLIDSCHSTGSGGGGGGGSDHDDAVVTTPPKKTCNLRELVKPALVNRNTCGTIYVGSTMSAPDKDATIKCVCGVYRAHMLQAAKDEAATGFRSPVRFDEYEIFNDRPADRRTVSSPLRTSATSDALGPSSASFSSLTYSSSSCRSSVSGTFLVSASQGSGPFSSGGGGGGDEMGIEALSLESVELAVPSLDEITAFYRDVFRRSQMETDCIIMSLIYVERLIKETNGGVRPRVGNWRSVLFASMVMASKVWDDLSMWNADFSQTCPAGVRFTLRRINELELAMLNCLKFSVKVPASEYAKYYFLLRSMMIRSGLAGDDLSSMTPLDVEGARRLEVMSGRFRADGEGDKLRAASLRALRSRSCGEMESCARGGEAVGGGGDGGRKTRGGEEGRRPTARGGPPGSASKVNLEQVVHL